MKPIRSVYLLFIVLLLVSRAVYSELKVEGEIPFWEISNSIRPLPELPLGISSGMAEITRLSELPNPPTPESVRLGRWLFFDNRLSNDNTISCASCHIPEYAFSALTPVSNGIHAQKGTRKTPPLLNQAWKALPHFFWDGRARSLEEQALSPLTNPREMGNKTHELVVAKLAAISGYSKYFKQAFGSEKITIERIAKAIADYQRSRMSGNSAWDQWRAGDQGAVSAEVRLGHRLFFGDAECDHCHQGPHFSDEIFHNLGIGWDPSTKSFTDLGRYAVVQQEVNKGAFKTPSLRDVSKRAPYMHDGSLKTLKEVVEFYSKGGKPNPYLDRKIISRFNRKSNFTEIEISAIVKFLEALDGEGYQDVAPTAFPQ